VSFSFQNLILAQQTFIVGGDDARIGEFPFQVSIQYKNGDHFCGGTLIRTNWVLTAAHCLDISKERIEVLVGLHDRRNKQDAEIFSVKRMIKHKKYNKQDIEFDIALIELQGHSKYSPIELNSEDIEFSSFDSPMAWVSGWGVIREGANFLPYVLQKVQLPLVNFELCNSKSFYNGKLKNHMICAGFKNGGKDSCQCDSGGPLFLITENFKTLQIGIVSYGEGCARPQKFGVYTKVSSFLDWIDLTIQSVQEPD
jgi:trypsin